MEQATGVLPLVLFIFRGHHVQIDRSADVDNYQQDGKKMKYVYNLMNNNMINDLIISTNIYLIILTSQLSLSSVLNEK